MTATPRTVRPFTGWHMTAIMIAVMCQPVNGRTVRGVAVIARFLGWADQSPPGASKRVW